MSRQTSRGRPTDRLRILNLLSESGGLSNAYIRGELNLTDGRYDELKKALLDEGILEVYRCRSGGVRLTPQGQRSVQGEVRAAMPSSSVARESDLYRHVVSYLEKQAAEDEIASVVVDTASLRNRGKWQNPDVTQVTIEKFKYLKTQSIIVSTYEVKQFGSWDVNAVYESASHRRFSHRAAVVLEWPSTEPFSLSSTNYRINQIAAECQRFQVGLYTLRKYYSSFRLHLEIEPVQHVPSNDDLERWLEYMMSRNGEKTDAYFKLLGISPD
jgi:hypothetical protein